jgi:hypothetical protein
MFPSTSRFSSPASSAHSALQIPSLDTPSFPVSPPPPPPVSTHSRVLTPQPPCRGRRGTMASRSCRTFTCSDARGRRFGGVDSPPLPNCCPPPVALGSADHLETKEEQQVVDWKSLGGDKSKDETIKGMYLIDCDDSLNRPWPLPRREILLQA